MSGDTNVRRLSLLERFDGIIACCAAQQNLIHSIQTVMLLLIVLLYQALLVI